MLKTLDLLVLRDDDAPANDDPTFWHWFGTLGALGWPAQYILDASGGAPVHARLLLRHGIAKFADRDPGLFARLQEFWRDHRDQYPTPRAGLPARLIRDTRYHARRKGWRTPDWYDEDRRLLDPDEHRRRCSAARNRSKAQDGIEILALIVNSLTDEQIAARVGCSTGTVHHWRDDRADLRGRSNGYWWEPAPGSRARLKEVQRALRRYFADPDADPYLALYEMGACHDQWIATYCKTVGIPAPVRADDEQEKMAS